MFFSKKDSDNLERIANSLDLLLRDKISVNAYPTLVEDNNNNNNNKVEEITVESVSLEELFEEEQKLKLDEIANKFKDVEELPFYLEDMLSDEDRSILET